VPKFDASFQSQNGLDLRDFDRFSRDWFPTVPAGGGSLTVTRDWPVQQLEALDAVQRALTVGLGTAHGIPFIAGQAAAQTNFLSSIPALSSQSPILQDFSRLMQAGRDPAAAIESALSIINELGIDALQGAVAAAETVAGVVQAVPLIGAYVALARQYGQIYYQAFKQVDAKAVRAARPAYDPEVDFGTCSILRNTAVTRDWTSVFSPAPADMPLASGSAPRSDYGAESFQRTAPHFAGRRVFDADSERLFAQWGGTGPALEVRPGDSGHMGFVPLWGAGSGNGGSGPRPNARPGGGVMWRGVILNKRTTGAIDPTLVGDSLPTAQAMGLSMWRAVNNPYAPQIFFVDAVELGRRWLNYLVQLRKGLHLSHQRDAFQFLKDWRDHMSPFGDEDRFAARLWLSFSKVEGGDLYKQRDWRRAACDALVPVFGWAPWQGDAEDAMVRKYEDVEAISDAEYIDKFDLNNAAPVVACRELFKRQTEATQAVTVLYSREDDPAFRSHAPLRRLRDRCVQKAVNIPQIRGAADTDMVDPALIKQAGQQLWNPSSPVAAFDPARKSQTYLIKDVWVGDVPPPGIWAGKLNLTSLPAMKKLDLGTPGGGGGAGILLLGLSAAGVFIAARRPK